jgi:hypothetical protein
VSVAACSFYGPSCLSLDLLLVGVIVGGHGGQMSGVQAEDGTFN